MTISQIAGGGVHSRHRSAPRGKSAWLPTCYLHSLPRRKIGCATSPLERWSFLQKLALFYANRLPQACYGNPKPLFALAVIPVIAKRTIDTQRHFELDDVFHLVLRQIKKFLFFAGKNLE